MVNSKGRGLGLANAVVMLAIFLTASVVRAVTPTTFIPYERENCYLAFADLSADAAGSLNGTTDCGDAYSRGADFKPIGTEIVNVLQVGQSVAANGESVGHRRSNAATHLSDNAVNLSRHAMKRGRNS